MTHQKRLSAPKHYPIERKNQTYITTTTGSRSPENSIPALLFLREATNYAETKKEAKQIVKDGKLLLNGKPINDVKQGLGVLDTVTLPETEETYRIIPKPQELKFLPVNTEKHLAKVTGKTNNGENFTYHLHNGENISSDQNIDTKTTLVLKEGKIQEKIPVEEEQEALVIQGKHAGKTGTIQKIEEQEKSEDTAIIENENEKFQTQLKNLLAINNEVKVTE